MAKPLNFQSLSLNDTSYDDDIIRSPKDSDARLLEMLQAQAAHHANADLEDEVIANDDKLSESEKKQLLQKILNMVASNGDVDKVKKLLQGKSRTFVDVNAPDEDGTPPLIYASCFVRARGRPVFAKSIIPC